MTSGNSWSNQRVSGKFHLTRSREVGNSHGGVEHQQFVRLDWSLLSTLFSWRSSATRHPDLFLELVVLIFLMSILHRFVKITPHLLRLKVFWVFVFPELFVATLNIVQDSVLIFVRKLGPFNVSLVFSPLLAAILLAYQPHRPRSFICSSPTSGPSACFLFTSFILVFSLPLFSLSWSIWRCVSASQLRLWWLAQNCRLLGRPVASLRLFLEAFSSINAYLVGKVALWGVRNGRTITSNLSWGCSDWSLQLLLLKRR